MDGDRIISAPCFRSYLNKFAQHLPSTPLIVLMFVLDWNMKSLNLKRKCKVRRNLLGNPTLPPAMRTNLETSYAAADERRREIEAQLHRIDHHDGHVVDPHRPDASARSTGPAG